MAIDTSIYVASASSINVAIITIRRGNAGGKNSKMKEKTVSLPGKRGEVGGHELESATRPDISDTSLNLARSPTHSSPTHSSPTHSNHTNTEFSTHRETHTGGVGGSKEAEVHSKSPNSNVPMLVGPDDFKPVVQQK